jgi:hypothetical protein
MALFTENGFTPALVCRPIGAFQLDNPAQNAMGTGMYCPNRQSMLCSQKHCSFWKHCEEEFGGRVRSS